MAEPGSPSSASESDNSQNVPTPRISNFYKSFSIETLLKKPEPSPRLRWDMLFQRQCMSKQICPVPPNMVVPRRYFDPSKETKDSCPLPDSSVSPVNFSASALQEGEEAYDENKKEEGNSSVANANSSTVPEEDEMSTNDEPSIYKKKRPRTAFSVNQIRTLEAEFERNRYLTGSKRKELSRELNLTETQIKIWFQNRRTKLKRKNVSEMENWVQQLYSPLGPMAPRPLVIGDHLYLFSNPGAPPGANIPTCPILHAPFEPCHSRAWPS